MNLNILSNPVMIATSDEWLGNATLTDHMTSHSLGASIWKEINRAHQAMLERVKWRMSIEAKRAELIALVTKLDNRHDRKARALHSLLLALADATDDADFAQFLGKVYGLMFPQQLRIVHMSYFDEAGSVMELEARIEPELVHKLNGIRSGDQSLGDLYRDWVKAGKELGRHAQERARIEASLTQEGTASQRVHVRKVRALWIRAVRLLLDGIDVMEVPEATREMLLAPLKKSIQEAIMRRGQGSADSDILDDVDVDVDVDVDTDVDVDADVDVDVDVDTGVPDRDGAGDASEAVTAEFPVFAADSNAAPASANRDDATA